MHRDRHQRLCRLGTMTHRLLHLVSSASKEQRAAIKQSCRRTFPRVEVKTRRGPRLSVSASRHLNQPVPWARSTGLTDWTPASWWTPASPAGFGSRSAPRLRRCWPGTWPACVGTNPGCVPGKRRPGRLEAVHRVVVCITVSCVIPVAFLSGNSLFHWLDIQTNTTTKPRFCFSP